MKKGITTPFDVLRASLVALVPEIDGVVGVVGGMDGISVTDVDGETVEVVVRVKVTDSADAKKIVDKVADFVEKVVRGTLGFGYLVKVVVLIEDVAE